MGVRRIKAIIGQIFSSRAVWLGPVLFAVVYLGLQLTQISAYGVSWDEPLHRNWGKIFSFFWQTGDRRLLELMPGNGIHYGPLYFYLNFVLSEFLYSRDWLPFVEANHILTVFASTFAVGFTYALGQMIDGKKTGFLAACFLVLFPQFIAHAHYNPKDIPLMVAITLTAAVFVQALRKNSRSLLMVSAFLFGLSVAVKINALLMAPVFGITYIFWLYKAIRSSSASIVLRRQIPTFFLAIIASVVGLYLFWPSAWGDLSLIPQSVDFFLEEDFWPGKVLFFGTEYGGKELPFYYVPFEFAVGMPFLMLVSCIVGLAAATRRLRPRQMHVEYLLLFLWVVFPLLYSMKPGLVRYDGMRQFYFILPAVAVLSALGLQQLLVLLKRKSKNPISGKVFIGLVFFSLITQVLALHPFEGSYRSELLQLAYHSNLDESFQIEYWGSSYKQGMEWLTENAQQNPIICVPTAGVLVTWYPWRDDFVFECSKESHYVMFFTKYTDARAYRELKAPVFSIERLKSTLLVIYKIK